MATTLKTAATKSSAVSRSRPSSRRPTVKLSASLQRHEHQSTLVSNIQRVCISGLVAGVTLLSSGSAWADGTVAMEQIESTPVAVELTTEVEASVTKATELVASMVVPPPGDAPEPVAVIASEVSSESSAELVAEVASESESAESTVAVPVAETASESAEPAAVTPVVEEATSTPVDVTPAVETSTPVEVTPAVDTSTPVEETPAVETSTPVEEASAVAVVEAEVTPAVPQVVVVEVAAPVETTPVVVVVEEPTAPVEVVLAVETPAATEKEVEVVEAPPATPTEVSTPVKDSEEKEEVNPTSHAPIKELSIQDQAAYQRIEEVIEKMESVIAPLEDKIESLPESRLQERLEKQLEVMEADLGKAEQLLDKEQDFQTVEQMTDKLFQQIRSLAAAVGIKI